MPAEYEDIKRSVGGDKSRASAIYVSQGKTAKARSGRAALLASHRKRRKKPK